MGCHRGFRGGEARVKKQGGHRVRRVSSKIGITESTKGVDSSRTYVEDAASSIVGVANDIGDLADVTSHEEVDVVDEHVTGPT